MNRRNLILFLPFFIILLTLINCLTETEKKATDNAEKNTVKNTGINRLYEKTGWISAGKYRAVVFILTDDECKNTSWNDIKEKIKYEAYKHLQKELNPSFDRFTGTQIKKLLDNSGKLVKLDKDCYGSNIYFYDIEKKDLESDFTNIKNIKKY